MARQETKRRSKATVRAVILAHVRTGSSRRHAAALAGVPFSTFYDWLEERKFAADVTAAEAEFERLAVERIDAAARRGSWRAQLALLERRLPAEWQERQRVEFDDPDGMTADERAWLRQFRAACEQPIEQQNADVRESLRLHLHAAADDGDVEFLRSIRDQCERLLASPMVRRA